MNHPTMYEYGQNTVTITSSVGKKKGCKTQWVHDFLIFNFTYLNITTNHNVYLWSRHLDLGFAQPIVSLCKDEGGTSEDDVILLYLDQSLIT